VVTTVGVYSGDVVGGSNEPVRTVVIDGSFGGGIFGMLSSMTCIMPA
jgi:hypothetical protein